MSRLTERERGHVLAVLDEQIGSTISASASIGATTIYVDDPHAFPEDQGQLIIGTDIYTYDVVNDDAKTVHLTSGLVVAVTTADQALLYPVAIDRWAKIRVNDVYDEGDLLRARVPKHLYPNLPTGTRRTDGEEQVSCIFDSALGVWIVEDAPGQDAETVFGGVLAAAATAMRDFMFPEPGAMSAIADPGVPYYPAFPGTLVSVRAALRVPASTGLTLADVLKNGTTIFTDSSHRPAIAAGDLTNLASGIDVPDFVVGDFFQFIWPEVGAGAADGAITLGMCVKPGCVPLLGTPPPPAPPFSPSDISGLTLWLKADDMGAFSDGDAVGTWPDRSGHGHDFTQSIPGNKPIYHMGILNGLPVVHFEGTSGHFLDGGDLSAAFPSAATLIVVFRQTAGDGFCVYVTANNDTWWTYYGGAGALGVFRAARVDPSVGFPDNATTWHTARFISGSSTYKVNLDDADIATYSAGFAGGTHHVLGAGLGGGGGGTTQRHQTGDVAEVIGYNRDDLSAGDITNLIAYRIAKWGV